MNGYEQEFRRILDIDTPFRDLEFSEREFIGRINEDYRIKTYFASTLYPEYMEGLVISVLDNQDRIADSKYLPFLQVLGEKSATDAFSAKFVEPMFYDPDLNGNTEWLGFEMTTKDYKMLTDAVNDFLDSFIYGDLSKMESECQYADANRARLSSDLPDCIRDLFALEQELGGETARFADWIQAIYDINDDFEYPLYTISAEVRRAFQGIKEGYGEETAQTLYNSMAVVLPEELPAAAYYLSIGGKTEELDGLASIGLFMCTEKLESYPREDQQRLVEYMNAGGSAGSAYEILKQNPESPAFFMR